MIKKGPKLSVEGLTENLAFSMDGKLLAMPDTENNEVNIWDIASQKHIKALKQDTWGVEALKFSPDAVNSRLAITDGYENIKLYNGPDWEMYATISTSFIHDIAFTPDGKTLVSGGIGEVEFWSVENGERISSIEGDSRSVKSVDISADGKLVASGDNDGIIRIWDISQYLHAHQIASSDVVKPIYFLPSNRAPQADIREKIDDLLKDVQKFFADEMERHGLERKNFAFEKNEDGSAKVYLFEGRTTDDYYVQNAYRKVSKEIYQRFDSSKNVYLIAVDISSDKSNISSRIVTAGPKLFTISSKKETWGQRGGEIIMPADPDGYASSSLAYMFGYAFGLGYDFREASYLMSHGRKQKQLSKSSAEWLNKSRIFNPNQPFFDVPTTIEKLSPLEGKVRFNIQDTDGIYQVRLLVKPTDENPPPGYQRKKDPEQNKIDWESTYKGTKFVLYDYMTVSAENKTTVQFEFPKFVKNQIKVQVIDGHGNMVYREMNLVEKRQSVIRSLFRRILGRR